MIRRRLQTVNDEPSKTIQSDTPRADIHEILKKYHEVGIVDHLASVDAMFLDVSEFTDYADLRRQTAEAEQHFLSLPSKLREVFNHDVYDWLDAAHDPEKLSRYEERLSQIGFPVPGRSNAQVAETPLEGSGSPPSNGDQPSTE